jgi:uncharacterized membrane protein YqaE (UPF0057 family)
LRSYVTSAISWRTASRDKKRWWIARNATQHDTITPLQVFMLTMAISDIVKLILAIFLPPLGVFLERGCNADFFINILLTILGYIPVCSAGSAQLYANFLTRP